MCLSKRSHPERETGDGRVCVYSTAEIFWHALSPPSHSHIRDWTHSHLAHSILASTYLYTHYTTTDIPTHKCNMHTLLWVPLSPDLLAASATLSRPSIEFKELSCTTIMFLVLEESLFSWRAVLIICYESGLYPIRATEKGTNVFTE